MPVVSASFPTLSEIRALPSAAPTEASQPHDIARLTSQLVAGSETAFREFHSRYFDRLYHFLLMVTEGQEHAAQDALQETLLRVVRHARRFDSEEIFWCWLKAVARNAARDGGRKQRRYFALLERFSLRQVEIDPAESRLEDERLRGLIEAGLAELSPEDREFIAAKYLHGVSVMELAQQTGLTEKAVESRLLRARRDLAERILRHLGKS